MEKALYLCKIEQKVTHHASMKDELPLGDKARFVQCLSCGTMSIKDVEIDRIMS